MPTLDRTTMHAFAPAPVSAGALPTPDLGSPLSGPPQQGWDSGPHRWDNAPQMWDNASPYVAQPYAPYAADPQPYSVRPSPRLPAAPQYWAQPAPQRDPQARLDELFPVLRAPTTAPVPVLAPAPAVPYQQGSPHHRSSGGFEMALWGGGGLIGSGVLVHRAVAAHGAARDASEAFATIEQAARTSVATASRTLDEGQALREATALVGTPAFTAFTSRGDSVAPVVEAVGAVHSSQASALEAARALSKGGAAAVFSAGNLHVPLAFDDPLTSIAHQIDVGTYEWPVYQTHYFPFTRFAAEHPNVSVAGSSTSPAMYRMGSAAEVALADARSAISGGGWKPLVYGTAALVVGGLGAYLLGRGVSGMREAD